MGFLEIRLHDVGVDLGCGDVGMTQQFLNVTDGCAAFEHFGCAGVAQRMNGVDVAKSGTVAVKDELLPEIVGL